MLIIKKVQLLYNNTTAFDKEWMYYNNNINKKNTMFIFFYYKYFLINQLYNSNVCTSNYSSWIIIYRRFYGYNKNLKELLLYYLGYNKKTMYRDVDEYYYICFRYFLKTYSDYLTLSWVLLYLRLRTYLLPLLIKGVRFYKNYPSRGQRTRSNYRTMRYFSGYKHVYSFKRDGKASFYPTWNNIDRYTHYQLR